MISIKGIKNGILITVRSDAIGVRERLTLSIAEYEELKKLMEVGEGKMVSTCLCGKPRTPEQEEQLKKDFDEFLEKEQHSKTSTNNSLDKSVSVPTVFGKAEKTKNYCQYCQHCHATGKDVYVEKPKAILCKNGDEWHTFYEPVCIECGIQIKTDIKEGIEKPQKPSEWIRDKAKEDSGYERNTRPYPSFYEQAIMDFLDLLHKD